MGNSNHVTSSDITWLTWIMLAAGFWIAVGLLSISLHLGDIDEALREGGFNGGQCNHGQVGPPP